MAKAHVITTNFTPGVWSPRLRGRVDLAEKYNSSLRDASNVVVLKQGGVTARPPLRYMGDIGAMGSAARILAFVYSNDVSYVLELGVPNIRVWKNGAVVESSPGVPFTVANPYTADQTAEMDFVQSGDTVIMAHPDVPLKRLRRFADANWVIDNAPLDPGPIAEIGSRANLMITLGATSGSGVTATASGDFFRSGDVGRAFSYLGGTAMVASYISTTQVTLDISAAFTTTSLPGNGWLLHGSPQIALTPTAKDPVGQTIQLTGSGTAFRSADVGAYVQINGGLVRLTSATGLPAASDTHDGDGVNDTFAYTFQILSNSEIEVRVGGALQGYGVDYTLTGVGSSGGGTVVFRATDIPPVGVGNVVLSRTTGAASIGTGVIVQELTSTTASPADAWVLKHAIWNSVDGYPSAVTLHEQRLWAGGTTRYPQSLWGSRSGLFFDFTPGTDDDHAVYKTVDSPQANPIRFLHASRTLIALTDASELEVRGGVEKPITQTNAAIRKQSKWGCKSIKPEEVGDNLIYVQRGGKVLRAIFALEVEGFGAKDISVYAEHLLRAKVVGITHQQTPESIVWAWLNDGTFVAITYDAEQNVIALAPCSTGTAGAPGAVESMCTVPEGDEDVTYLVVNRTIGGATKRYMERFDWDANPGMDSFATGTTGPTTWGGFSHLASEAVTVLMDGLADGQETVNGSGQITTSESATTVYAGLAYEPSITLQDPEIGTSSGTAQGAAISTNKVIVRFHETFGCNVNDEPMLFERFGDEPLNPVNALLTGDLNITEIGWSDDGSDPLTISQPQPYHWTVLAVIRHITVNTG